MDFLKDEKVGSVNGEIIEFLSKEEFLFDSGEYENEIVKHDFRESKVVSFNFYEDHLYVKVKRRCGIGAVGFVNDKVFNFTKNNYSSFIKAHTKAVRWAEKYK